MPPITRVATSMRNTTLWANRKPDAGISSTFVHKIRAESPNDSKLSDGRGWRDACRVERRAAA
jgi:hypothetical protein